MFGSSQPKWSTTMSVFIPVTERTRNIPKHATDQKFAVSKHMDGRATETREWKVDGVYHWEVRDGESGVVIASGAQQVLPLDHFND